MTMKDFENKQTPSICVPLTGKTKNEVLEQLDKILKQAPDIIEWRADFFSELSDVKKVIQVVGEMKQMTDLPLLFTIRASHEGGETISLTEAEKVHVLTEVCTKTAIQMVDYEASNDEKYVQAIREVAEANDKTLILSYHNFTSTPANEELVSVAKQAERAGAHLVKLAVMPQTKADVFRLLEVTNVIDERLDVPVITMSMGELGGLSRVIGWAYGSIITFGVGVERSAPGQIPVEKLRAVIEETQQLLPSWQ